jgi:hypothetical protein
MSVADINTQTAARIATIDTQTTAAIKAANDIMPDLEDLASQIASYFTPASIEYTETQFDASGVATPTFIELADADASLSAINADGLPDPTAGSGGLSPELSARLSEVQSELSTLWQDVNAVQPTALTFNENDYVADIITSVAVEIASNLDDPDQATSHAGEYQDNDSVRRQTARTAEIDNTVNEFAGRGFSMSLETLGDMQAFITTKQGMDEAARARTVIIQQAGLSLENKRKAIDAGLRYDQILIAHFDRKQQRALAVAQATLKVLQDLVDLKTSVIGDLAGVQGDLAGLITESQRLVIAEGEQTARAFEARIDALMAKAGGFLDAESAEAQAYVVRMKALNADKSFWIDERGTSVEVLRTNMANTIRAWIDSLHTFEATTKIRLGSASVAAGLQLGLASAAKNSITTVTGLLSGQTASAAGA